jgi:hypothetical protein
MPQYGDWIKYSVVDAKGKRMLGLFRMSTRAEFPNLRKRHVLSIFQTIIFCQTQSNIKLPGLAQAGLYFLEKQAGI